MDKNTEDVAALVPPEIMKHYKDIHLDIYIYICIYIYINIYIYIYILFVNKTPFLLSISRDIRFIHCRAIVSNHNKHVQNVLKQIAVDYQSMGFKVVTAFRGGTFEHLVERARSELHIDLIT